jgi:paraquat-inducible protein A
MRRWGMLEVYLVAIFIALTKLRDIADIQFGLGFYSFVALLLCIGGVMYTLDYSDVWDAIEEQQQ